MEHRLSERHRVGLDVVLKRSGQPDVTVQGINIAQDGMFVYTKRALLKKGETLDAEFSLMEGSGVMRYCQKSWVVHSNDKGAGLMFIHSKSSKQKKEE